MLWPLSAERSGDNRSTPCLKLGVNHKHSEFKAMVRRFLTLLVLLVAGSSAVADDTAAAKAELRLGLLAHDPLGHEAGSFAVAGDILWRIKGPSALLPRLHLGFVGNTYGRTSYIHAGGTWQLDVTSRVFIEAGLGLALHSGATGHDGGRHRAAMGCRFAFREALGMGYRLDARWQIIASIEHLSNGGLCKKNRGLTQIGLRTGYSF
jgi:hypothetical protein